MGRSYVEDEQQEILETAAEQNSGMDQFGKFLKLFVKARKYAL